jgi:hypothetical protein
MKRSRAARYADGMGDIQIGREIPFKIFNNRARGQKNGFQNCGNSADVNIIYIVLKEFNFHMVLLAPFIFVPTNLEGNR